RGQRQARDQRVGLGGKREQQAAALVAGQIQGDAALAGVEELMKRAGFEMTRAKLRLRPSQRVARAILDAHHVMAELCQNPRAVGADDRGEIEDARHQAGSSRIKASAAVASSLSHSRSASRPPSPMRGASVATTGALARNAN